MDINTKKIITLLLLLPLIIFIGLSIYFKLNEESSPIVNDELAQERPTNTPVKPTDLADLSITMSGKYWFSNREYSLTLKSTLVSKHPPSSQLLEGNIWLLEDDDMKLYISPALDESPFGSNDELSIQKIMNISMSKSIYRIPLMDNYYFYTDRYFNDSCGGRHCSNGYITNTDSEDFSIDCEIKTDSGLKVCDELVQNLEIINN